MNKISSYERQAIEIFQKENIRFIKEKTFEDLHCGHYRFDFYFPDLGVCCELQGEQHYKFTKRFFKSRSDFLKAQERDRTKISYCLSHNIPLYCIPWWDMDKITTSSDYLKPEYRASSIFHNDNAYREYLKR